MAVIRKFVNRFTYPAEAPLTSITVYYVILIVVSAVLLYLFPGLERAFSGRRLAEMLGAMPLTSQPALPGGNLSWEFALFLGIAMVGAFLLMLPTSWVYMSTRQKRGFEQNIVQTIVVLAMAVAGVVVIVRNSLALAFSLAGIVGAVRFRNSLPDTRDTLYIFLAIGVGLAAGVEALAAAAVLSMIFNYAVAMLQRADYGMCELGKSSRAVLLTREAAAGPDRAKKRAPDFNAVVVVRATAAEAAREKVEPFLGTRVKRWELAEVEVSKKGRAHLKYRIRLSKRTTPGEFEDALVAVGAPVVVGARVH